MADATVPKICGLCGEDCSQKPRIKDPAGQYFCRACYEAALEEQRARRRAAEIPPEPVGLAADVAATRQPAPDEAVDLEYVLDEPAPQTAPTLVCPGCGAAMAADAVLCVNCGYSARATTQLTTTSHEARRDRSGAVEGIGAMLLSPVSAGLGLTAVFGLLFVLGLAIPDLALFYVLVEGFVALCIGVTVLVFAFMHGIGQGLLTLCIPFYVLYFVFGVCENRYVKWLFGANLLGYAGAIYFQFQIEGGLP